MKIEPSDTLIDVSYKVCTALEQAGITAVLVGGSAASFYAPSDYMSVDSDFCISFHKQDGPLKTAMESLGFTQVSGRMWSSPSTPITIDFVGYTILIGSEEITAWNVMQQGELVLNVLNPTDIITDRLLCFGSWNDLQALKAAVAIAKACPGQLDQELLEARCRREGIEDALSEFMTRLSR